jgi:hypothetical protein
VFVKKERFDEKEKRGVKFWEENKSKLGKEIKNRENNMLHVMSVLHAVKTLYQKKKRRREKCRDDDG